jgi:hypothetical protein
MKFDQRAMTTEAGKIEEAAKSNLMAWVLTGQGDKYGEEMAKARNLRTAAAINYKEGRKEFCEFMGIDFSRYNVAGLRG